MRRQIVLPEHDREYLDATGLPWETLREGAHSWLIVRQIQVPPGYNLGEVAVALQIPAGYPDAQIDMAYFFPHLARTDGRAIGALTTTKIDGETWQRWSRHRAPCSQWRAGVDAIDTHLLLVRAWLEAEVEKKAA